jgi:hypothetical protein
VNNITRDNVVEKIDWHHHVVPACSSTREGLAILRRKSRTRKVRRLKVAGALKAATKVD